jgi:phosphoribosylaminoimidazole (AIR) synthetase
MGAGFAVYSPEGTGERVVEIARGQGLRAHVAGHVTTGPRRVVLSEIDVVFEGEDLHLGPRG